MVTKELSKETFKYQRIVNKRKNIFLMIETMLRTKLCKPGKPKYKVCLEHLAIRGRGSHGQ